MPHESLVGFVTVIATIAAITCVAVLFTRSRNREWHASKRSLELARRTLKQYGSWTAVEQAARRGPDGKTIIRLPKRSKE